MTKLYSCLKPVILLLALGLFWAFSSNLEAVEVSQSDLIEVLPEAEVFIRRQMPWPYYEAYKSSQTEKTLVGLCFLTTDLFPEEKGYNGPIKILVGMNLKGIITGIKIMEHSETPAYVRGMSEPHFPRQFIGKTVFDPFQVGRDIDCISRATITTQSIVRSVRKGTRQLASQILKMENLPPEPTLQDEFKHHQIYIFILAVFCAIGAYVSKNRIFRYSVLVFSFVYLGLIKAHFISLQNFIQIIKWSVPPLTGNLYWFFFLFAVLVATFIWGRLYCGHLCPFGVLNEGVRRVFRDRVANFDIEAAWHIRARTFKYLIVLTIILVFYLTNNRQVLNCEVYINLFTLQYGLIPWMFLIFVLLVSLWRPFFWCQYLCPVGALLGIISQNSLFKIRLKCFRNQKDDYCRRCVQACFMHAIEEKNLNINHAECIRCNECRHVCPRDKKK